MKKLIIISLLFGLSACTNNSNNTDKVDDQVGPEFFLDVSKLNADDGLVVPAIPAIEISGSASGGTKVVNLVNSSSTAFALSSIALGEGNPNFSIKLNRCGASIPAKKSCAVTLSFSARNVYEGTYSSTLDINGESAQISAVVSLKPDPELVPGVFAGLSYSLNIPFLPVTTSADRVLTIANTGTVVAQNLSFTIPAGYILKINRCSSSLKVGASCRVVLTHSGFRANTPPAEGNIQVASSNAGTLTPLSITTNLPFSSVNLTLQYPVLAKVKVFAQGAIQGDPALHVSSGEALKDLNLVAGSYNVLVGGSVDSSHYLQIMDPSYNCSPVALDWRLDGDSGYSCPVTVGGTLVTRDFRPGVRSGIAIVIEGPLDIDSKVDQVIFRLTNEGTPYVFSKQNLGSNLILLTLDTPQLIADGTIVLNGGNNPIEISIDSSYENYPTEGVQLNNLPTYLRQSPSRDAYATLFAQFEDMKSFSVISLVHPEPNLVPLTFSITSPLLISAGNMMAEDGGNNSDIGIGTGVPFSKTFSNLDMNYGSYIIHASLVIPSAAKIAIECTSVLNEGTEFKTVGPYQFIQSPYIPTLFYLNGGDEFMIVNSNAQFNVSSGKYTGVLEVVLLNEQRSGPVSAISCEFKIIPL